MSFPSRLFRRDHWHLKGPAVGLTLGLLMSMLTLSAAQAQTSSNPAQILSQGSLSAPVDESSESPSDPVSRFLNEKGLIDTRPVVNAASRVRERAANVASDLVISAMDFLGVPYRMGGQSRESGFDCSGFTRHVFERSLGMILPRRASEQANMPGLLQVNQSELKPGDLVFFNTLRHTFSHVGIYIGDNKFIHSPRAGGSVRVEDMRLDYWQQRFEGGRRAPNLNRNSPLGALQPTAKANNGSDSAP
jgi:cell wall-associated NlpC family hydrolase